MKCVKFITLLCLTLCSFVSLAASEAIRIQGNSDVSSLPLTLLKAITKNNPQYHLDFPYDGQGNLTKSRLLEEVKNGQIDIHWSQSNAAFEEDYNAIYIPIYRGLIGLRLAVVPKDKRNILQNVRTLEDLQQYTAGSGSLWSDTITLIHNGIPVVKEQKFPNLFPMLEGGRFDYFPRGLHEPWRELDRWPEYNLIVEPHILIRYAAPFYFFVTRENAKVTRFLNNALNELYASGEFERLFFADKDVARALENANLADRKVIELSSPNITSRTPLDKAHLWFNPYKN
ncbi:ABC transporter substrate-binding protein [Algibacillus agarilyticus]|uniref:ABC transporter substrate-binding protein n=1 Tax=Algibacillus agarilyticus TaxID=2234133 RepID=UPI000DD04A3C|nr:ABC transporter substrate-binding protein [Algibacillus agarilyticus]